MSSHLESREARSATRSDGVNVGSRSRAALAAVRATGAVSFSWDPEARAEGHASNGRAASAASERPVPETQPLR